MHSPAIGSQLILTTIEQLVCSQIAIFRHQKNRASKVPNKKIGRQSDFQTDLEGVGAEFAFAKLFNLMPDLSIAPRSSMSGTDLGDAVLPNGATVDVKSTRSNDGCLVVVPWKRPTSKLLCLMTGEFPTYTLRGFIETRAAIDPANLCDLGHGKVYAINQNRLKELSDALTTDEFSLGASHA
jgi:hypothetical protein